MLLYVVKRLFQTIPLLLVISALIFTLLYLMPGDPLYRMLEGIPNLRPEDYERLRRLYGFDDAIYVLTIHSRLLSRSPDALQKLRTEIASVVGDAPPTQTDLKKMHYLSFVLKEGPTSHPRRHGTLGNKTHRNRNHHSARLRPLLLPVPDFDQVSGY